VTNTSTRRLADHLPNVPLRTHRGAAVHFYDDLVKGKAVLINFMFTQCTAACPAATANLARLQAALGPHAGHDVFLVSISIDPEHDDPATLARYAAQHHAGPGWTFATGSAADVARLQRGLGMDPRDGQLHTGMLIYGNEMKGRWAATPIMQNAASLARIVLRVVGPAA
jgi:protein SCO1